MNEAVQQKKHAGIYGYELAYLGVLAVITAFLGWLAENFGCLVFDGRIDSRYHILPLIPPYALIPVAAAVIFGDPDRWTFFGRRVFKKDTTATKILSNLCVLVICCAVVVVGEFCVGNLYETLFGEVLWNYSSQPLSFGKYNAIIPTVGYGGGAWLVMKFVYKPLMNIMRRKLRYKTAVIICAVVLPLMLADAAAMLIQTATVGAPMYWRLDIF